MRAEHVVTYLESLARPDGGYGWEDQPDSYLSVTFAVIGSYRFLGMCPPRREALARYIRQAHPIRSERTETRIHSTDPRLFVYEEVQSLLWLDDDASEYAREVSLWTGPEPYPRRYEAHGYPLLREQAVALICRRLLGLSVDDVLPGFLSYFLSRQRANGSFNHTPASDRSDGHVVNTWWALRALEGAEGFEPGRELVPWLQAAQLPSGGFTYQPDPPLAGCDDVLYTLAAVDSLNRLGAAPLRCEDCVAYLRSLHNEDGGFGYRPGEPSCPVATLYALWALHSLGVLPHAGSETPERRERARAKAQGRPTLEGRPKLPEDLGIYSIQIQAPGAGSPAEAVMLANELKIDLWGAKNAPPGWIERAQEMAQREGVPVTFFQANEEYGTWVGVPGLGMYTHLSDPIAPSGVDMGAAEPGRENPWDEFRTSRFAALEKARGRMVWQICDNEELSRILLDDSLARGGYAAISAFHFGCRNMAFTVPFLFRYRHLIPFVSLQDAHGVESWWWTDHLVGFRTLFLGTEATWDAWLEALERRWVVAVRHDADTYFRTRLLGGAPGVQEYVARREAQWRWWDPDQPERLERPVASIVAVRPGDPFETAAPERGVHVRVRTQWVTNHLAILQRPIFELIALEWDGETLPFEPVERRDRQGRLIDSYYVAPGPESRHRSGLGPGSMSGPGLGSEPGRHQITATLRHMESGALTKVRRMLTV